MTVELEVTKFCGGCQGTGMDSSQFGGTVPCGICGGDGRLTVGNIDITDLDDKLNDIMDKCNDIFEQVTGG